MAFEKATFYLRKNNKVTQVNGQVNKDFGFYTLPYRNGGIKCWVAADLKTGETITSQSTRKKCVDWIVTNVELINYQRSLPEYEEKVKWLKAALGGKTNGN